ncbi:MAG: HigA family addiction module antidote protein [Prolixibacteraceae bacterium]|nr:HigA family addiction module antidote protein [Prolixibacteraceae bacterium]
MKTMNDLTPFKATHPGTLIKDEIDAIPELNQKELAIQLGLKPSFLNEVIKGKRPITADLAILLEKALGISADYWMKFQSQYEIDKSRIKEKNILRVKNMEVWSVIKKYVPVHYFRKLGYLKENLTEDILTIKTIYAVTNIEQLIKNFAQNKSAFYRKSEKLEVDEKNIFAWSSLAQYEAHNKTVNSFNPDNLNRLSEELKAIFFRNVNTIVEVYKTLDKYGIKLLLIEKPAKTPVDGFSFWSGNNPAIALTLRHSRIDNFAFTLMHEIGHIQLHLLNNKGRSFLDLKGGKQVGVFEDEADKFAQEKLIPKNNWKIISHVKFCNKQKQVNDDLVISYAQNFGINPAILLGRICFESNDYAVKTNISKKLN